VRDRVGAGLPDWPLCYGGILPPLDMGAVIETTHRVFAVLTTPLIVAAAVVGWRRHRAIRWLSRPPALAVVLVLAVVVFGAFAVLTGLPPMVAAIDVGSALLVLALLLTAWGVARARRIDPARPDRLAFSGPFARLALAALASVYLVLVSGVLVADVGSLARCLGWPSTAPSRAPPRSVHPSGGTPRPGGPGGPRDPGRRCPGLAEPPGMRRDPCGVDRGGGAVPAGSGGRRRHGGPRLHHARRRALRRGGRRRLRPAGRRDRAGRRDAPTP